LLQLPLRPARRAGPGGQQAFPQQQKQQHEQQSFLQQQHPQQKQQQGAAFPQASPTQAAPSSNGAVLWGFPANYHSSPASQNSQQQQQRFFPKQKWKENKMRMSAYDINTTIRMHSSHMPLPLPFNEDYYYRSYLALRQRSCPSHLRSLPVVVLTLALSEGKQPVSPHTPLCETQPLPVKKYSGTLVFVFAEGDLMVVGPDDVIAILACEQTPRIRSRAHWAVSPTTACVRHVRSCRLIPI